MCFMSFRTLISLKLASLALLIGLFTALPSAEALMLKDFRQKPFNILGQRGVTYKPNNAQTNQSGHNNSQQFLTLNGLNGFIAANLFGNLNNQFLVQQLAQQALNSSKKASNVRLQLRQITILGQGTYPVPSGLSQQTQYQHVRAEFTALDKATNQPLKGKEAGRSLEVLVIRLNPGAANEDIITTYAMDGAISQPQLNDFVALLASQ